MERPTLICYSQDHHYIQVHINIIFIHIIQNLHHTVVPNNIQNKCIFCRSNHWSDKCNLISDSKTRRYFWLKSERCLFLKNWTIEVGTAKNLKSVFIIKGCTTLVFATKIIVTIFLNLQMMKLTKIVIQQPPKRQLFYSRQWKFRLKIYQTKSKSK